MSGCLFCSIAAGDVPATIISETPRTLAFRDIDPQAPVHVLVIPRAHHANLEELVGLGEDDLLREVLAHAAQVAQSEGIGNGHRIVFNTGGLGGQTVDHVHAHVLGGRQLTWPPG